MKELCTFGKKHGKALTALFFAAILLVGLLTVMDYGKPWDEPGEINILRMALMEYGELLPFETGFHQSLSEMSVVRLSESIERDHGSSLYYPLAGIVCNPSLSSHQLTFYWRAYTWLLFSLGGFALYALCRRMGLSRALGCLGVLFLMLSPRFFADGHYNNKDIALMVVVLVVLWQTARLTEKPSFGRGTLFAVAAAFCVSTRVIGAAVCGLCGLLLLARLFLRRELNGRTVRVGLFTLGLSVLLYLLLTPSFLADPGGYIVYVLRNSYSFSRWNGQVLFMGGVIDLSWTRPPLYYLPVMFALTTPVWALALLVLGQLGALRAMWRGRLRVLLTDEGFIVTLCSLTWFLSLLGCILMRVRVYNGWRHVYFLYGPMLVLMVYGYAKLWAHARIRVVPRRVIAGAAAVLLGVNGALLALNHPYQYAYYNPLVPRNGLETSYELDYWNVSMLDALKALVEQAGQEEPLRVLPSDGKTRSGVVHAIDRLGVNGRVELLPVGEPASGPYYVIANTTYAQLAGWSPTEDMQAVHSITAYGATLATVYYKGAQTP